MLGFNNLHGALHSQVNEATLVLDRPSRYPCDHLENLSTLFVTHQVLAKNTLFCLVEELGMCWSLKGESTASEAAVEAFHARALKNNL